jgi:hypothetical protein
LELACNERYYVPSEITWLLKSLGFSEIAIHGCKMGAFSRDAKLTTDDFEMLVVAKKPEHRHIVQRKPKSWLRSNQSLSKFC